MPILAAFVAGIIVWLILGKSDGQPVSDAQGCSRVFLWCVVLIVGLGLFAAIAAK